MADASAAGILMEWLGRYAKGNVDAAVRLDVLEAAQKRKEPEVVQALAAIEDAAKAIGPIAVHQPCLEGGDVEQGRRIFFDNEATRCTRCHTAMGRGGNAGPVLDGIGTRQTRDYLLESLVIPGAKIAQGFATTVLRLHNGDTIAGVVTKDQDGGVEIVDAQGNVQKVPSDRIADRSASNQSAMPVMAGTLDRRQIRDVVAFLASMKSPPK